MTMREGYMAYMKMVTDNFIKMQSVEKPTKQALGYVDSDDTVWPLTWKADDGLRWGTGNYELFLHATPEEIKKHNGKIALLYLCHNTKTYEEYLEFMHTPIHD